MRYSVGSGLGPRCNSRYIRTCCDMAAATLWRTPATTHGRCKLGSATRTSSTRCVTPNLRRIDLRTSGDNRRSRRAALTAPARGWPKNVMTNYALTLAEGSWDINSTRALSSPHVVLQREVNHEARSVRYR